MANKLSVVASLLAYALIWWKPSKNARSAENYGSEKEQKETRDSLADKEWVHRYPVPIYPMSPEEVTECLAERNARYEALKAATSTDALVEKAVFERLFMEEKNGKLVMITPAYMGNAGFRRASQYFAAMSTRFRADLPISGMIPVMIKEYATEEDQLFDQQEENELQQVGTVPMTILDRLRVTKSLFDLGCREIKIRKLYSSSTGQKLFNICMLNFYFPQLNIYDRCFLAADNPDSIPLSKLRHDALVQLVNRYEAQEKREKGRPMTDKERAMTPITAEDVSNYLSEQRKKEGSEPKIMQKKDIEQGSKTNRIGFFRSAFQAVMDNSPNTISPYMVWADGLNTMKELIDTGKGTVATEAVTIANRDPVFVGILKTAFDKGLWEKAVQAVKDVLEPPVVPQATQDALALAQRDPALVAVLKSVEAEKLPAVAAAVNLVLNPPPAPAPAAAENGSKDKKTTAKVGK